MIIEVCTYQFKPGTLADEEGWPPGSGATGAIVEQENMLVAPASFSPIR